MLCLLTRAWVFVGVEWLAFKIGLLGCSLFLYFVTTALVAVLLRETQARVHQWSRTFSAALVANRQRSLDRSPVEYTTQCG